MLSRDEIQSALGASRAISVNVSNPHGPLGLEQLAAAVQQLVHQCPPEHQIQRSISLPLETWERLDDLAKKLTQSASRPVTASEVATSLVVQAIDSVAPP